MFKELKVIKLIVFVGLLVAILSKIDYQDLALDHLVFDKSQYRAGEKITVWAGTKAPLISSLASDLVDFEEEVIASQTVKLERVSYEPKAVLEQGLNLTKATEILLPSSLKSGIYQFSKDYPVVVNGDWNAEVTWVYPAMNNLIYERIEQLDVFGAGIVKTSMKRGVKIDPFSKGIAEVTRELNSNYSSNYITDYQLEETKFFGTKLLIIYGKSSFWTPLMLKNLNEYIKNGGNVLCMTTYALNNVCWFKPNTDEVVLFDSNRSESIESWLGYANKPPREIIGGSHRYGGTSEKSNYEVMQKSHPIFKSVKGLGITSALYSSPPVVWSDNKAQMDTTYAQFYESKLLAYSESATKTGNRGVKAIYEIQPDSVGGRLIHLGTDDWCTEMGKNEQVLLVARNAIDYLVKSSIK